MHPQTMEQLLPTLAAKSHTAKQSNDPVSCSTSHTSPPSSTASAISTDFRTSTLLEGVVAKKTPANWEHLVHGMSPWRPGHLLPASCSRKPPEFLRCKCQPHLSPDGASSRETVTDLPAALK